MFKQYDLVRPRDDPFKSIWQIYRLDDDGGALLYRLGHNPDIHYFEEYPYSDGWEIRTHYYSNNPVYCYAGTFVKLTVTEEEDHD